MSSGDNRKSIAHAVVEERGGQHRSNGASASVGAAQHHSPPRPVGIVAEDVHGKSAAQLDAPTGLIAVTTKFSGSSGSGGTQQSGAGGRQPTQIAQGGPTSGRAGAAAATTSSVAVVNSAQPQSGRAASNGRDDRGTREERGSRDERSNSGNRVKNLALPLRSSAAAPQTASSTAAQDWQQAGSGYGPLSHATAAAAPRSAAATRSSGSSTVGGSPRTPLQGRANRESIIGSGSISNADAAAVLVSFASDPCTMDEVRLLSPLVTLREHFDALRHQHDKGESLLSHRVQPNTVILRASVAMSFHHIDALLLNKQLVVIENTSMRDILVRASELWHRDDVEHLDNLSETLQELERTIKARMTLVIGQPVVRLSRLAALWFLFASRDAHFSSRVLSIGIVAIIQIALLVINVATGTRPQLIVSLVMFAVCIATYLFLALLVQHATVFSPTDIIRSVLCPDVEWLTPDDLINDAPITWYRRSLLMSNCASGAWDDGSEGRAMFGGLGNALPLTSLTTHTPALTTHNRGGSLFSARPHAMGGSGGDTVVSSRLFPRQRPCLLGNSGGALYLHNTQPSNTAAGTNNTTDAHQHGVAAGAGHPSSSVYAASSTHYGSVGAGLIRRNSSGLIRAEGDSMRGSTLSSRFGGAGGGAAGGAPPPTVTLAILDMIRQKRMGVLFNSDLFAMFAPLIVVHRERDEIVTVTDVALEMTSSTASQVIGTKVSRVFSCEYVGPARANSGGCRPVILRFHHHHPLSTTTSSKHSQTNSSGTVAFHAVQCYAKRCALPSAASSGSGLQGGFPKSAMSSVGGLHNARSGGSVVFGVPGGQDDIAALHHHGGGNASGLGSAMSWAPQWNDDTAMLANFGGGSSGQNGNAATISAHASIAQMFQTGQHRQGSSSMRASAAASLLAHPLSAQIEPAESVSKQQNEATGGTTTTKLSSSQSDKHFVMYLLVDRVQQQQQPTQQGVSSGAFGGDLSRTTAILEGGRRSATDAASLSDVMALRFPPSAASLMRDSGTSATHMLAHQSQPHLMPLALLTGSTPQGTVAASRGGGATSMLLSPSAGWGGQQALSPTTPSSGCTVADDQTKEVLRRAIIAAAPSADIRFSQTLPALAIDHLPISTISRVIKTLVALWQDDPSYGGVVVYFDHEDAAVPAAASGSPPVVVASHSGGSAGCALEEESVGSCGATGVVRGDLASPVGLEAPNTGGSGSAFSDSATTTPSGGSRHTRLYRSITVRITPDIARHSAKSSAAQSRAQVHEEMSEILRVAGIVTYTHDERTQNTRLQWSAALRPPPALPSSAGDPVGAAVGVPPPTAITTTEGLQLPSLLPFDGLHGLIVDDMNNRRRRMSSVTSGGSEEHHVGGSEGVRVLFYSTANHVQDDAAALACLFQSGALVTYIGGGNLPKLSRRLQQQLVQHNNLNSTSNRLWLGSGASGGLTTTFDLLLMDWDPELNAAAEVQLGGTNSAGAAAPLSSAICSAARRGVRGDTEPPQCKSSSLDDGAAISPSHWHNSAIVACGPSEDSVDERLVVLSYLRNIGKHQHHATFLFSRRGSREPSPAAGVVRSTILTTSWDGTDAVGLDTMLQPMVHAVLRYLPVLRQAAQSALSNQAWPKTGGGGKLIGVGNAGVEILSRDSRVAPIYALGRRLGAGGFGDVFEVRLNISGGVLAMKRIFVQEEAVFEEVRREVDLMASFEHKNLVQLSHCTVEEQCVCLFMELCDGSLSQLLRPFQCSGAAPTTAGAAAAAAHLQSGHGSSLPTTQPSLALACSSSNLTSLQMVQIINDILSGLRYLHHQGIAHRDLKPENILFREGVAKISDFGSAARDRGEKAPFRTMKGTLSYMAPEVILGEPYGKCCDLWSMGCIIAELIGVPLLHLHNLTIPKLTEYYAALGMEDSLDVQEIPSSVGLAMSGSGRPPELGATRSPVPRSLDASRATPASVTPTPQRLALPSDVVSLLRGCFARDPQRRLTADELLAHPVAFDEVWLTQMRLAVAERLPKELVATGGSGALIQFHSIDMSLDSLGAV